MNRAIRSTAAVALVLGATLVVAQPASARTISVNCDTTSLQPKLDNAPTGSTLLLSGTCQGAFTVSKDLTLKGNPTATLDGATTGATLTVTGARSIHLRSLIVTGGLAQEGGGIDQEGGGLLTLDHVTVRGNEAAGATAIGGGIDAKDAVVAIRNSTLSNNHSVSSGSGLAVAQGGAIEIQTGSLTISNSVIRGNQASAVSTASLAEADGGAVAAFETTTSISSSQFRNNVVNANAASDTSAESGALVWQQDAGDLTITGSTFANNRASATSDGTREVDAFAGAIRVGAESGTGPSVVKISETTFDGNQTSATASNASPTARGAVAQGGAALIESESGVVRLSFVNVLNSTLSADGATTARASGGGLQATGAVALDHSTVSGNMAHAHTNSQAADATGGGIAMPSGTATTIATSSISNNTSLAESDNSGAGAGGGGIEIGGSAHLVLRTSTVSGNTASATSNGASGEALGGGIDLENTTATTTDLLTNSTIAGNHATGSSSDAAGAGLEVVDHALSVRFSTIARNGATASGSGPPFEGGGGIDVETGSASFEAVILALNTGTVGPNCLGTIASSGFNVLGPLTNCVWGAAGTDQTNVTTPKIGQLAANGGPTMTIGLLAGSPAIDKVPTVSCHAVVHKDQRGVARPQGSACDVGSFERKT